MDENREVSLVNLSPEDAAKLLSNFSEQPITLAEIESDIEDGAPCNENGRLSILDYGAWLARKVTKLG